MSIEQTSQLISLILNSVLMTLLSAVLVGGAWLRQNSLCFQLAQVQKQYRQLTQQQFSAKTNDSQPTQTRNQLKANLRKVRYQRQQLIRQYRWSYTGMLLLHVGLLVFGVSLLALSLRSLFSIDGLISTALVLFTLGVLGLLAGTSCVFIDILQDNTSSNTLTRICTQLSQQISRRWQRGQWQRSGQLTPTPIPSLSLKPLSLSTPISSKRLPSSVQKPDSFVN